MRPSTARALAAVLAFGGAAGAATVPRLLVGGSEPVRRVAIPSPAAKQTPPLRVPSMFPFEIFVPRNQRLAETSRGSETSAPVETSASGPARPEALVTVRSSPPTREWSEPAPEVETNADPPAPAPSPAPIAVPPSAPEPQPEPEPTPAPAPTIAPAPAVPPAPTPKPDESVATNDARHEPAAAPAHQGPADREPSRKRGKGHAKPKPPKHVEPVAAAPPTATLPGHHPLPDGPAQNEPTQNGPAEHGPTENQPPVNQSSEPDDAEPAGDEEHDADEGTRDDGHGKHGEPNGDEDRGGGRDK